MSPELREHVILLKMGAVSLLNPARQRAGQMLPYTASSWLSSTDTSVEYGDVAAHPKPPRRRHAVHSHRPPSVPVPRLRPGAD